MLQLWLNWTLRQIVSQEQQTSSSIPSASQLHEPYSAPDMIQGQIHHISADEAQEDPEVVIGMFLVNDIPVVILFDSGASHSYYFAEFCFPKQFSLIDFRKAHAGTIPGNPTQKQSHLPKFGN